MNNVDVCALFQYYYCSVVAGSRMFICVFYVAFSVLHGWNKLCCLLLGRAELSFLVCIALT